MILRLTTLILVLATGALASRPACAGDSDDKDHVFRKGAPPMAVYVESENVEFVNYRTIKAQATPGRLRTSDLDHIDYAGMDSGAWAKGVEARDGGNFETAAEYFDKLVTDGTREWEKVYGAFAEGECWELAGNYANAAKSFGVIAGGYAGNPASTPPIPAHRLWLDGKYRQGMALALAKSTPEATKIADELETLGKKATVLGAEARANAIRSAMAAADGNLNNFVSFMKKVTFRAFDEREVWFHYKMFCAETLRNGFKKGKDAASIYREILSGLGNDPARQAQCSLGLGLCLVDNDRQGALIELLKLDVLPYGSPDQKCEARFNAGQLLWAEAQSIKANTDAMKDERKAQFVKDTERAARLIVTAALDGPAKNPNVALAKSLLASFGPDPDAPKDAKKDAKAEGAPAQPAAAK